MKRRRTFRIRRETTLLTKFRLTKGVKMLLRNLGETLWSSH